MALGLAWEDGAWVDAAWIPAAWSDSRVAVVGTPITNANASTDKIVHYEVCQRTGFKVKRGTLIKDGYGLWVRPDSYESRHPSEFVRSVAEKQSGSPRPEQENRFVAVNEVKAEDL